MNNEVKPQTPQPLDDKPLLKREGRGPIPIEIRERALLFLESGIKPKVVAQTLGVSIECLRLWRRAAEAKKDEPAKAGGEAESKSVIEVKAAHPGGLSQIEVDAILDLKKKQPSMGPAQIKAQLKRFKGYRVSHKAIARVLKNNGYELEKRGKSTKEEETRRWEAPYRNVIWQMDFADLRVGSEKVSLLLMLDDFSRFVVGSRLMTEVTSEQVVEELRCAIAKHGKPQAVYTDRGGPFLSWRREGALEGFLEEQLIDHHVSAPYHPQGRGKIEALIHTVQKELWEVIHFESVDEARMAVDRFVHRYNHERAHMGIDGLTPADRFFGRWAEVKERIEEQTRRRERALALNVPPTQSEDLPSRESPQEVLRMMVVDGVMEIRLMGHKVVVGKVEA